MIITIDKQEINYQDPFDYYEKHSQNGQSVSLLMESRFRHLDYGRESIVLPNAALQITGKNDHFCITALTETGEAILSYFEKSDFDYANKVIITDDKIEGIVTKADTRNLTELERIRQKNISFVIRTILDKFSSIPDEHAGLYGAFAYDFARNFENFGNRFIDDEGSPDFNLFMPSTIVYFDDIKERAEIRRFYFEGKNDGLESKLTLPDFQEPPFRTYEDMSIGEYQDKVSEIIKQIKNGRLIQCVLSRNQGMSLKKHPINSYAQLRDDNRSPYCFFFSLGSNEYLYGASPEIHVKVSDQEIEIRPIAGTKRSSDNAKDDFDIKRALINDTKELSEHAMLVDLARNDIDRLIEGMAHVQKYADLEHFTILYHLVSSVRGKLRPGIDALDAILTTLPAGTLSGAPKVEAMKMIEELENSRRGFYGGAIGYLTFNGNCNTGITIRSIHVKDNMSYVRAGAGIVALSIPGEEANEIKLKSEKAMRVLQ